MGQVNSFLLTVKKYIFDVQVIGHTQILNLRRATNLYIFFYTKMTSQFNKEIW